MSSIEFKVNDSVFYLKKTNHDQVQKIPACIIRVNKTRYTIAFSFNGKTQVKTVNKENVVKAD